VARATKEDSDQAPATKYRIIIEQSFNAHMIKTQNFQRNGKKFLGNGIPVAIAWTTSVDRGLAAACAARTWHLSCPRTKNAALTRACLHTVFGAGFTLI
jgi:hypothetical protein